MSVRVVVRDGELIHEAMRRLKKQIRYTGIVYEMRKHEYYTSPGQRRRAAKGRAERKEHAMTEWWFT